MSEPTTVVKLKALEYLQKENPLLVKDAIKQVEKIEPHFYYFTTLSKIFYKFLEARGLREEQIQGVHISRNLINERTLFISVVLWLYSPNIYNSHAEYSVEDGVRHELEGLLLCNAQWISQQVKGISFQYRSNYQEFRDLVNELLTIIKSSVKEKEVIEENKTEMVGLFQ